MKVNGLKFKNWTVDAEFCAYANGRTAIRLSSFSDGPIAVATVNLPDSAPCGEDEIYVKDYSENEGMSDWLIANGFIERPILGTVNSGYVLIARYKLTTSAIEQRDAAKVA